MKHLVSAGGLVYRIKEGNVEVVICGMGSPPTWGLPKGTPDPHETRQETALREVSEETGLETQIEGFIDSIEYWFVRSADRVRYHKRVFFYLMSPTGGDLSLHDHEFDTVEWMPVEQALETLTHDNEVRIVQKGLPMVAQNTPLG